MAAVTGGRVFDGKSWTDVDDTVPVLRGHQQPVPPILDGDGKIHVAVASFRGTVMAYGQSVLYE
jgi:hypothetical protein